ncbi:MAG TPA: prolyl oligopeptidase family serine peptidase [Candidatus Eisenbacteria bacterium]|nr:prolyl oligopeptidase family serine peptidase [Candidatus Eisenbacteria bacterium]
MNARAVIASAAVILSSAPAAPAFAADTRPAYPATRVEEVVDDYFGTKVTDPYRWLEDETKPDVKAWVAQQNALTRRYLDAIPERQALHARLESLYQATVASAPRVRGETFFYTRRPDGKNQPITYVSQGKMKSGERTLVDPNTWSADGTVAMDWSYPSPDGALFAYGRSESGSEKTTLHIVDVKKGTELSDKIPNTRAASITWKKDGSGFYYERYPAKGSVPDGDENYYRHVFYHKLGEDPTQDAEVYGKDRPKEEWEGVYPSNDFRYVFLSRSLDWAKNDLFVRQLDGGTAFTPISVGGDGQVQADVMGDHLVLRTDIGAPHYRIVTAPVGEPGPEHWKDLVPESDAVIENMEVAGDRLLVQTLENAHSRLWIYDASGKKLSEVALPTLGTVTELAAHPNGREAYFTFDSFAFPTAVFRLDVHTASLEKVEQLDPGTDLSGIETEQVWYSSKDGTKVPMFVVHKKGLAKDGSNRVVLSGYGGFEVNQVPHFSRNVVPWIEGGGVYALANLRGGGEFGRAWHEAGRLDKKQNVFDDFIAAGDYLVREGYTSKEHLAILGGSNGGLLTGACVVQRPDLFRAAIVAVPLLDMLRYEKFAIARLWIPEYGTAEDPKQFPFLYAYSPYQHVTAGTAYPAILLTTAESDSRVAPLHAMKMAARLQVATSSDRPILLRVEAKAGHGQGRPVSKTIEEAADIYSFLLWQTGGSSSPAGGTHASIPSEAGR